MPTIDANLKDLHKLIGRPLSVTELDDALMFAKAEVESHDLQTGDIRISLEDTNQPYLWSAEGIAMLLRGVLGLEKGLPTIMVASSKDEVIVDPSVKTIRGHIAVFCAKGPGVTDTSLRQLIQFQEKFCDTYGLKRSKVSIGIYRSDKVRFPVTYKAVTPESLKFTPLGMSTSMTPREILKEHPTGKAYEHTLAGLKAYPLLMDANDNVLSLIPIINSNDLGKVEVGDNNLMFECTGTDARAVELCANIFAHSLWMRGFSISSCTVKSGKDRIVTPTIKSDTVNLELNAINKTLGSTFSSADAKKLLERARHTVNTVKPKTKTASESLSVSVPSYRDDVLHPIDIIEDVAIMADYNTLPVHPLTSYTVGDVKPIEHTMDTIRDTLAGFGMQEILSPVLCNPELLDTKMGGAAGRERIVEISDYMSASYTCVRSWILPILIEVLSKNLHREYPQHLYETGEVVIRKGESAHDIEHCGALLCSPEADYTRIRQVLEAILAGMGLGPVTYEPLREDDAYYGSFIPGRAAICRVKGVIVAHLGEIHPEVLDRFSIRMPVSGMEIDISALHGLRK